MGWLITLLAAVVAVGVFAYLAGIAREQGKTAQELGDLADENTSLRLLAAGLEEWCATQHNRIVAMTAWELLPWPGRPGAPSPAPARPSLAGYTDPATLIPRPRPRRERHTSTAAFLTPAAAARFCEEDKEPAQVFAIFDEGVSRSQNEDSDKWWPEVEQEIAAAKIFLARLG